MRRYSLSQIATSNTNNKHLRYLLNSLIKQIYKYCTDAKFCVSTEIIEYRTGAIHCVPLKLNNMKKILFFTILALLCAPAFSQADTTTIFYKADSLKYVADSLLYKERKYELALDFYNQVSSVTKEIDNGNNTRHIDALLDIATVYYYCMGDYQNALKYNIMAMETRKNFLGEEHPDYAKSLNNIGILYSKMGDYQSALKYYLQSADALKHILGDKHPDYASLLENIGVLYYHIDDYNSALKFSTEAMEIKKASLGEENINYAISLNNLCNIYSKLGDYQKALEYGTLSSEIYKKIKGENHTDYARSLNNIAAIYREMEEKQNALKYIIQAMEIKKNAFGESHPEYASSLNNVGVIYLDMKDYRNALEYMTKAAEIWKKTLGNEHPQYATSLKNISQTYFDTKDYKNAISSNKIATDIYKRNLIRNFSFMTSHEREAYWDANNENFIYNIKYMYHEPDDTIATKTSYDTELITKGLLLASEISVVNTIMESGDTALIAEYENMKTLHLQINKELEKPIAEHIYNCDSLENEIQETERHIMESCKELGDVTHFIKIDWKEVQNSLMANDVAIEFSSFTEDDTTKYVALVLTKDMDAPVCVPLFEQSEMQKHLRNIYDTPEMYNLIWKPLEKYFPENPRIFFAPSGMLHRIAVEYAPVGNGKTISDKYEIYRVSSTRFLAMDYTPKPLKNSVLYGGVYYDIDTTSMKLESERFTTRSAEINSFSDLNKDEARSALPYLQGTKTEVENIAAKMKKKKISATLYEGAQANEESFKALSGKDIDVLHIATHGFFLPTDEKLSGDQSLVQSGLLLSGANYAWQNKPLPEGIEDGILTAKEISFMDLRKTDLVVLSACQTALGEITSEGVFGLQRGFKKAGAHTIIMSLWPVDDNATLLMMTEFYANLTNGMSKREAFLAAQKKVKTTAGFENPRYWAAFIMLDGNE